ncbi:unnamed protein product, partial [Symbiodinium sp. CCMP2592]
RSFLGCGLIARSLILLSLHAALKQLSTIQDFADSLPELVKLKRPFPSMVARDREQTLQLPDEIAQTQDKSLRCIWEGLYAWMDDDVVVHLASRLRPYCMHDDRNVAQHARHLSCNFAQCLCRASSKRRRHAFAKDIAYWLEHGTLPDQIRACQELQEMFIAGRGLGRFEAKLL